MAGTTTRQKPKGATEKNGTVRRREVPIPVLIAEPTKTESLVKVLRERLGMTQQEIARMTGFSTRTIAKLEQEKNLTGVNRKRIEEVRRLQEALETVMNPEFIPTWLSTPNPAFDGLKPVEVIERGAIDRIWRMIFELESGAPS